MEAHINAKRVFVNQYELFPTRAEFNFAYTQNQKYIVFGSVMPEMNVRLDVGHYELHYDDEEFYEAFCESCRRRSSCDADLDVFNEGECIYTMNDVGEWESKDVYVELPKTVVLKVLSHTYLLTYVPEDKLAPHKALDIFNVYGDGKICWGNNEKPNTLREAWSRFWTSRFNLDLTKAEFRKETHLNKKYVLDNLHKTPELQKTLLTLTPKNILQPCDAAVVVNLQVIPAKQHKNRLYFNLNNELCYYKLSAD